MPWSTDNWPEERCESFEDLQERVTTMLRNAKMPKTWLAWRGLGNADLPLSSTLDRLIEDVAPDDEYSACVKRELSILEKFRHGALRFASEQERAYLQGGLKHGGGVECHGAR